MEILINFKPLLFTLINYWLILLFTGFLWGKYTYRVVI